MPDAVRLNALSEPLQLALSREALHRAALTIATQAEVLATGIETGTLADRGGPEALRLLAAFVREGSVNTLGPAGHG